MKKLSKYVGKYIIIYIIAIIGLVIFTGLDMYAPILSKQIIDDVLGQGRLELLSGILGGYLLIALGRVVAGYINEYLFDIAGAKIGADIRGDIFAHVQSLSADFFDGYGTGEIMSRVKEDVDHIWDGFSYVGRLMIQVVIHTGMILFCMYKMNWQLAILPTIAMVFCGLLALLLERKLGAIYEAISEENAQLNTVAEENLTGVRTVRAFAREEFEIQKFLAHNERFYELNMKQSKAFVKIHPLLSMISKLLPFVVLVLGGAMYVSQSGETITLGDLAAFVQYSMNIVWPMEMLGWLTNSVSSAVASNKRLRKLYHIKPTVTEVENPVLLPEVKRKLDFDGVGFVRGEKKVLDDITFTLEAGKTLGIMGATGAGKSSVLQLMQRMYDSTEGTIYLDDVDIRKLTLKQLRESIAVVSQEVFLFSDSIEENVRLGKRKTLTHEQVKRAVKDSQAGHFVEKLPQGYDTVIGERGVGLSGGQKQRISIARALAKKSPILVMDDSTSALDMETEQKIQETLKNMKDTTKIIIAHRISAVWTADEIIYLEDGRIAERGTHEQLMRKQGLYYETYMAQYGDTGVAVS